MSKIKHRWSPTLGSFESEPETVWGTSEYNPNTDSEQPTVFCGLYGLPDFYALWRHKGKRWVWWCGSDITHFMNGYWLEDGGGIRLESAPLGEWINKHCESWCENEVERLALAEQGIEAQVCPSFLGNKEEYEVTYEQSERPKVYMSVSGDNFEQYGWTIVEEIADRCAVDFHLYGNMTSWITKHPNVFVHGRVPKEQMNEEIKHMQSGLRLCIAMDGFSEITAKSILWGQYPIVAESYKYFGITGFRSIDHLVKELNGLRYKDKPNPARELYRRVINNYPWTK